MAHKPSDYSHKARQAADAARRGAEERAAIADYYAANPNALEADMAAVRRILATPKKEATSCA